ncbi:hypothetical protein N1851_015922 [Merluccius polli]|uniref:CCHC-type domain-containing protein n=1 Tax=Merluccius polli TaxID=89951 RepID=A0AA47P1Q4_MERPO|nr:hypothetical protein N1851_015922 [Merluccius polli]
MYINEQRATTLETAAVLADEYVLTHRIGMRDRPWKNETVNRVNLPPETSSPRQPDSSRRPASEVKCNYCKKPGHLVTECLSLKRKNAKGTGCIAAKCSLPLTPSVGEVNECDQSEGYKPFVRMGYVSLPGSDDPKPVRILRDTGASQSMVLEGVLPFTNKTALGSSVLVRGIGMTFIPVPLHKLHLKSDLIADYVVVGVRPSLPVPDIDFLLGNDIGGGDVWGKSGKLPEVVAVPLECGKKFPDVFPSCAITRAMSMETNVPMGTEEDDMTDPSSPITCRTTTISCSPITCRTTISCSLIPCSPIPCSPITCRTTISCSLIPCSPIPCSPITCSPIPCRPISCRTITCHTTISCSPIPCSPITCHTTINSIYTSCCREIFVGCTSMMRISRSTTSQRCSIGLRSDVQDAWAGKKVHVLLSKVGAYKIFYWDIYRVGPNMEMESEAINAYLSVIVQEYNDLNTGKAAFIDSNSLTKMWNRGTQRLKVIYPREKKTLFLDPLEESTGPQHLRRVQQQHLASQLCVSKLLALIGLAHIILPGHCELNDVDASDRRGPQHEIWSEIGRGDLRWEAESLLQMSGLWFWLAGLWWLLPFSYELSRRCRQDGSFCASCSLLFSAYLLNHKATPLSWRCFVPGWFTLSETKTSSSPLHSANDVPGSRDSVSIICSLTLVLLYSSVRLDRGSSRMPFPYSAMLLRHLGTPSHFLAKELTNLSSLSTFEIGTS